MLLTDLADQTVPRQQVENRRRMNFMQQEIYQDEAAVPGDSSVRQIIDQEMKYKRELWRLQKILRRGMSSEDPLPVFNRRHLLLLVKRLCKDMEYSTSQLRADMDISRLSEVLQNATPVSHGLLCIAYADTLYEIREFLKREMERRNDSNITICQELHAERSLLPLHRLKYLKSLTCISPQHNDAISSALDGCYVAISSLHSQRFVGEVDRLLDFALNMDPPPNHYFSTCRISPHYQEASNNEKSMGAFEDNVYEEIAPYIPKKKKGFFFRRGKNIMNNKDISAQEEFIPLATYQYKVKEIMA